MFRLYLDAKRFLEHDYKSLNVQNLIFLLNFGYNLLIKMTNIAGLCRLMKKIPDNNSNVTNSMVLVWYSELFGALRYKLI